MKSGWWTKERNRGTRPSQVPKGDYTEVVDNTPGGTTEVQSGPRVGKSGSTPLLKDDTNRDIQRSGRNPENSDGHLCQDRKFRDSELSPHERRRTSPEPIP